MITIGQSYRVTFQLSTDLTTASSVQIGYMDPTRTTTLVSAIVDDTVNGVIHYDVNKTTNITTGLWKWWAEVSFTDGSKYIGEAKELWVHSIGDIAR